MLTYETMPDKARRLLDEAVYTLWYAQQPLAALREFRNGKRRATRLMVDEAHWAGIDEGEAHGIILALCIMLDAELSDLEEAFTARAAERYGEPLYL